MAVDPKSTVETHVVITEDAARALDVRYSAVIAGTDEKVHLRGTHLAGLLMTAAFFVMVRELPELQAELTPMKERETEPKKGKHSK